MTYKYFKIIMITLFIAFLALYVSQSAGYYEFQQHKKMVLTEEKIKQFEQDIKDGKKIDIDNYLESVSKNYNNRLSSSGLRVSKTIDKGFNLVLDNFFTVFEKLFINY